MQTSILERSADLAALEPEWRALLGARPQLVMTPTWMLSWWRVMGREGGRSLRAIVVRDEQGALVGLWPLLRRVALEKNVIPFRRLEMLGSGEDPADEVCSDYLAPLVAEARRDAIIGAMVDAVVSGAAGSWDDLVVPAMPAGDPVVEALAAALRSRGVPTSLEPDGTCPYVALPATWEAYLASLDGDKRYFIRRTLRDFEKWAGPGGFALERVERETDLDGGLRTLAELHGDRWAGHGVFQSAKFSAFHRHVMRDMLRGRDGRLDLLVLRVRGEAIAAVYNLVVGGTSYFYQSGRRTDLPGKVRVGIVVHCIAMQRAIAEGHREYDFMKGDSQYKQKLGTGAHPLVTLRAVNPRVTSRALDAALNTATRLARELKRMVAASRLRLGRGPASEGPGGSPEGADGAQPDGAQPDGAQPEGAQPDGAHGARPDGTRPAGGPPGKRREGKQAGTRAGAAEALAATAVAVAVAVEAVPLDAAPTVSSPPR